MRPPRKPDAPAEDAPDCLTDGSNESIPRDYIKSWRVTESNKEQRIKELVYTINMLQSKGMDDLVVNSRRYERDF